MNNIETLDDSDGIDNMERVKIPNKLTILDITEDCTRLVFDRLTLNQLIHLRAVCHSWNDIITDICQKKRKLQIFFNKYEIEDYYYHTFSLNVQNDTQFKLVKQNTLTISRTPKFGIDGPNQALKRTGDGSFSEQQNDPNLGIRFIARLFPNITNFVCEIKYDRMFELNYILWKWSTNLLALTIFSDYYSNFNISENARQDFVQCFEQMSLLRRLHLLRHFEKFDFPNARTFGQLEEFSFNNCSTNFVPYFAQLDANRCTFLRVRTYYDRKDNSPNLPDANPELTSKLTHLSTSITSPNIQNHISHYLSQFQNLVHLEILSIQYCSVAKFLQQIVPMRRLETLVLPMEPFVNPLERAHYRDNPNYLQTFPIFHNTITALHLVDKDCDPYFPEFEEYQLLARTFPNVVNVKIYSNNLNKATFDAQFRPRFSGAFGERVEVIFFPTNKFNYYDF